jgi:hypothetical protein
MSLPLLLLSLLPTIWVVDASNGPGTNFTSLPAAVAAAGTGDTILVRPGIYEAFNVTGKALTIRGAGAATTMVQLAPPAGSTYSSTTIDGVPAGTAFYMSGMGFVAGTSIPASVYPGVRVLGATTDVVLADVTVSGVTCCTLFGTPALHVSGGAVVHASRSTFTGTPGYSQSGGSGAVITSGSKLAADACTFTGGGGAGGFFSVSGHGLAVDGATVTLANSSATGGTPTAGPAGHGISVIQNGFARVNGYPSNIIGGGQAAAPFQNGWSISADLTSSAIVHGLVTLMTPANGPVTVGGLGLPYAFMTGSNAPGGELLASQPVTVTFDAVIGWAQFAAIVDLAPGFSTALAPFAVGELLLPLPTTFALLSNTGPWPIHYITLIPAINMPWLVDVPVYLQFGVVNAAWNQVLLSNCVIRVFKG